MNRFPGAFIGYDVKSNQKTIKSTPGPGFYEPSSGEKKSHNVELQRGGVKKEKLCDYKDRIIKKSFNLAK